MIKRLFTKVGLEHFALGLQLPILVALPLARGITLAELGILEAILAVVLFLSEVPSGAVADRLGRRYAMILSNLAFACAFALFAFAYSFEALIPSFILMGFGFAMLSGADEAFLFDALKDQAREGEYARMYGKLTIVDETVTIFALVISAGIAAWFAPEIVFLVAAAFMILAALYGWLFLREQRVQTDVITDPVQQFERHPRALIRRAVRILHTHGSFLIVLGVFALLDESGRLLWQPRLLDLGFTLSMLGVIYAGLKLFSILGAWVAGQLPQGNPRRQFAGVALLAAAAFALMGFGTMALSIAGLALYFFSENVFRVFRSAYLNARIDSKYRATFLSMNSFSTSVFATLFVMGLGAVADARLAYGFLFLIGVKLIGAMASLFLPTEKTPA